VVDTDLLAVPDALCLPRREAEEASRPLQPCLAGVFVCARVSAEHRTDFNCCAHLGGFRTVGRKFRPIGHALPHGWDHDDGGRSQTEQTNRETRPSPAARPGRHHAAEKFADTRERRRWGRQRVRDGKGWGSRGGNAREPRRCARRGGVGRGEETAQRKQCHSTCGSVGLPRGGWAVANALRSRLTRRLQFSSDKGEAPRPFRIVLDQGGSASKP
jgi:hypothetical protein